MVESVLAKTASRILVVDDSVTVLRVVEGVLSQAGYQVTCRERGHDIVPVAKAAKPDLIFVDFAMPEVNGFRVCQMLGEDPDLQHIPIIIMATRGDAVGERFVRELRITDHISKPFAPEALLAITAHALEKAKRGRVDGRNRFVEPPEEEVDHRRHFVRALSTVVYGKSNKNFENKIYEALENTAATQALVALARAQQQEDLTGNLANVPAAEILQMLALQRQTGVLVFENSPASVNIWFKDGMVRLVTGRLLSDEFLLGKIILQEKLMEAGELETFLSNRRGTQRLLGSQLVKLGYFSQDNLHRVMKRQSSELLYELLRWHSGRFYFNKKQHVPTEVLEFEFGLTMDELLMEGFRRVDEWGMIEAVLPSLDVSIVHVPGGIEHLGPQGLSDEEKHIFGLIDGQRTARHIIDRSGRTTFEVARILYRLISARVTAARSAS